MVDFELDRLQLALPKRYTLLRELDRGGMSRVYLAREEMPDRDVAIKVFDEKLSAQLGRERFLREVEVTSQLGHPYIVPIHSAGDAEGALYYVMPFIRGESLRDRLEREGRLPIEEALKITEQVAGALAHAHQKGIIHRDIKPSNILFHGGHAVVADFGIARALRAAETRRPLTHAGTSIGTPDYMSPEQISGDADVGHETDIYALACVLYEMLGGQPPFHSRTRQATLARHLADTAPSLRGLRDTIPPDIERAIRRALSKAPVDRFGSVLKFVQALRQTVGPSSVRTPPSPHRPRWIQPWAVSWRLAGVLLVVGALGLAWSGWSDTVPPPVIAGSGTPLLDAVAMMPLENRTEDPTLEWLGRSIAEEVIFHLAKEPQIRPKGLHTVTSLMRDSLTTDQLIDTLNLTTLLGGFYELRLGRLVIGTWEYDETGTQIDGLRMDPIMLSTADSLVGPIALDIVDSYLESRGLSGRSMSEESRFGPGREAYIAGNALVGMRTPRGIREAVNRFQEAARLEPNNAEYQAALSSALALSLSYSYDLGEAAHRVAAMALAAADSAVDLDSNLASAYAARGYATMLLGMNIDDAASDFAMARYRQPNDANVASWRARVLAAQGDIEGALATARRAVEDDPLQSGRHMAVSAYAIQAGSPQEAIEAAGEALRLESDLVRAQARLAQAYALTGRADDCLALSLGPFELARAPCLVLDGQEEAARDLVATYEARLAADGKVFEGYLDGLVAVGLATYYAYIGDAAHSAQWAEEALILSPVGVDERILNSPLFERVLGNEAFSNRVARARQAAINSVLAERRRVEGL